MLAQAPSGNSRAARREEIARAPCKVRGDVLLRHRHRRPPRSFTQPECWDALQRARPPRARLRARARSCSGILNHDNGIERRSLALDSPRRGLRHRSRHAAPALRDARAARSPPRRRARALARRRPRRRATSTRSSSARAPAISARASRATSPSARPARRRLHARPGRPGLRRGAAQPAHRRGAPRLASAASNVLSICVEVCSAAMYLDNDPGVLVSACLFGDGAGAAVLSRAAARRAPRASNGRAARRSRDPSSATRCASRARRHAAQHPHAAGAAARRRARARRARRGARGARTSRATRSTAWIMHAGGREVLEALQRGDRALGHEDLRYSAACCANTAT